MPAVCRVGEETHARLVSGAGGEQTVLPWGAHSWCLCTRGKAMPASPTLQGGVWLGSMSLSHLGPRCRVVQA